MQIVIPYFSTLIILPAIEVVGITLVILPIFEGHVGDLLADPFRTVPAAALYAAYIVGVLYFVRPMNSSGLRHGPG